MDPQRPRLVRSVLAAVTAFALAALGAGAFEVWREAARQGWAGAGLEWLAPDLFSRTFAWKHGAVAAAATLVVALPLELLRARGGPLAFLRILTTVAGQPVVAGASVLALAFLPSLAAEATQPAAPPAAPNVLFVLVDTWRADHTGFLGYHRDVSPKLDRLVEEGVIFENAISQSGWTKPAVASLFTGLVPSKHLAVSQPLPNTPVRGGHLPPHVTTFVEVLRARGWDTALWSNNPNITPPRGFGQGAGYFRDYFHDPARTPDHDPGKIHRMLPDVERWLQSERDPDRPFCAYVHVMDPHFPYEAPAPFAGTYDTSGLDFQLDGPTCLDYMSGNKKRADVTPEMIQRLKDVYDEELLYVDHFLGDFLERVRARFPDTVIVVAGDHGEEFFEHGNFGHSHGIWQELTHVPLLLFAPGLEPRRIPAQVRLMDVFPTILDLAGLKADLPPETQGESLVPVARGTETAHRPAPMEVGGDQRPAWQWRGISDGRYKMLRRERNLPTLQPVLPLSEWDSPEGLPKDWLFDLETDPGEQVNLHSDQAERTEELLKLMIGQGYYVTPSDLLKLRAEAANISAEDAAELEALGYGGGGEAKTP